MVAGEAGRDAITLTFARNNRMNESLLVECAQWIYANKKRIEDEGREVWWTPYSLTSLNTDKTNPQIPINEAFEVFMELVKRRLATHEFVVKDDKPFPVFMMKKGKDEEWQNLIRKKGFWDLKGLPFIILCIKKFWLVIVFALTVVATNILAEYTKHRTKGFLAPPPEVQLQSPQSPTQEGQR